MQARTAFITEGIEIMAFQKSHKGTNLARTTRT